MPPDSPKAETPAPKTRWLSPSVQVQWGPYFRPDPAEQKQIVDMVIAALGASGGTSLVTRRAAIQKVASIFGIDNVDAAIKALEKEDEEKAKKALENAKAMQAMSGKSDEPVGSPAPKPKKDDE